MRGSQACSHLVSLYMRHVPPLPLWLPCNAMWRHQAAVQCRLNGPLVSCSPDTSPSSPSPRHPHSLLFCTLCAMCGMCPKLQSRVIWSASDMCLQMIIPNSLLPAAGSPLYLAQHGSKMSNQEQIQVVTQSGQSLQKLTNVILYLV